MKVNIVPNDDFFVSTSTNEVSAIVRELQDSDLTFMSGKGNQTIRSDHIIDTNEIIISSRNEHHFLVIWVECQPSDTGSMNLVVVSYFSGFNVYNPDTSIHSSQSQKCSRTVENHVNRIEIREFPLVDSQIFLKTQKPQSFISSEGCHEVIGRMKSEVRNLFGLMRNSARNFVGLKIENVDLEIALA